MELIVYAARCAEGTEHNAAYELLALALERELGISELPTIEREAGGKPYFPARPEICFNLSHSHGAAACALHDKPVGVDIEKLRPAPRRLAAGMDDEAFFRLWTAREATIKRAGQGVAKLLKPFAPDPLCQTPEGLLDGYIITVCPTAAAEVRAVSLPTIPGNGKTPRNY